MQWISVSIRSEWVRQTLDTFEHVQRFFIFQKQGLVDQSAKEDPSRMVTEFDAWTQSFRLAVGPETFGEPPRLWTWRAVFFPNLVRGVLVVFSVQRLQGRRARAPIMQCASIEMCRIFLPPPAFLNASTDMSSLKANLVLKCAPRIPERLHGPVVRP